MVTQDTTTHPANPTLTTADGAPVANNQNSQTAGPNGPILMQDHHLIEKLAHFNRERVPERVVHAVGIGAGGVFEVTNDVSQYTCAAFLSEVGKKTEVFTRFSTVAGAQGAPDSARDPRGFSVKFYTEEGNYDLVGNNTPIFFIRDPLKFPDFIHTQKPDPRTKVQEPDNVWDFFALSPELTHQFTWLFGDRGRPKSLQNMDGFGSHTFQWVNAEGKGVWVKYHFKTDQGIECLSDDDLLDVTGGNPEYMLSELRDSIDAGKFPSWTVMVQIMPFEDAPNYRFNPFDLTKTWSQKDYPKIEVGRMTLNRWPDNYFAETEQSAFNPANFVPGIGPSPDKMLQGRLFGYGDAHRYRLGTNYHQVPVNHPHATKARTYGRDGLTRVDGNGGASKNYEPNSFGGPVQTSVPTYAGVPVDGLSGSYPWTLHEQDDDFTQAGELYRLMDEPARQRLVTAIAGSLSRVSKEEIVSGSVAHFAAADPEYGARVEAAVKKLRAQGATADDPQKEAATMVV
ncbi:catalase [Nakamurella flavida]|uniref:Catalase n=1 Tax=Nakamurella flavida TaxID=363630 RepID=A0A938YPC8_9ACTN|nr:catalase [Nakamurella flavida]MBM9477042.1 catalase [Nakamurella flavida]MDP9779988.1 catalase [Nakamurella flavida]